MLGIEPRHLLLERSGLPLAYTPTAKKLRLFRLFVYSVLFAPLAVFFEFQLSLHGLFILFRPIIIALTDGTLKSNEIGLGHSYFIVYRCLLYAVLWR